MCSRYLDNNRHHTAADVSWSRWWSAFQGCLGVYEWACTLLSCNLSLSPFLTNRHFDVTNGFIPLLITPPDPSSVIQLLSTKTHFYHDQTAAFTRKKALHYLRTWFTHRKHVLHRSETPKNASVCLPYSRFVIKGALNKIQNCWKYTHPQVNKDLQ